MHAAAPAPQRAPLARDMRLLCRGTDMQVPKTTFNSTLINVHLPHAAPSRPLRQRRERCAQHCGWDKGKAIAIHRSNILWRWRGKRTSRTCRLSASSASAASAARSMPTAPRARSATAPHAAAPSCTCSARRHGGRNDSAGEAVWDPCLGGGSGSARSARRHRPQRRAGPASRTMDRRWGARDEVWPGSKPCVCSLGDRVSVHHCAARCTFGTACA